MGLDMYLSARLYTSMYTNKQAYAALKERALPGVTLPHSGDPTGAITLEFPVMYWRKANAIHAWFVHNCQDGEDDCRTSDVSTDQLRELFMLVGELLDSRDPAEVLEKLPPTSGFFFGSTDVDEDFWNDLQETHNVLAKLVIGQLDKGLLKGWDFQYRASW